MLRLAFSLKMLYARGSKYQPGLERQWQELDVKQRTIYWILAVSFTMFSLLTAVQPVLAKPSQQGQAHSQGKANDNQSKDSRSNQTDAGVSENQHTAAKSDNSRIASSNSGKSLTSNNSKNSSSSSGQLAAASTASRGNKGTVKLDGQPFDAHPNNQPHVGCDFQTDFYNYYSGNTTINSVFRAHPPTGRGVLKTDRVWVGGPGEPSAQPTYNLANALSAYTPHKKQGYHVKLTAQTEGAPGAGKHKVFWVNCLPIARLAPPAHLSGPPKTPLKPSTAIKPIAAFPTSPAVGPAVLPDTGATDPSNNLWLILFLGGLVLTVRFYPALAKLAFRVNKRLESGLLGRQLASLGVMVVVSALPLWQLKPTAAGATALPTNYSYSIKLEGRPSRLQIPRLGIDLNVIGNNYDAAAKIWPVATAEANYAANTALINNYQNQTLIYGHNNHKVLGKTDDLQVGDSLLIRTDNGHTFEYVYRADEIIKPSDAWIFSSLSGQPGLKLLTCAGDQFELRRLMDFQLVNAF